jgi:hypothetical protein
MVWQSENSYSQTQGRKNCCKHTVSVKMPLHNRPRVGTSCADYLEGTLSQHYAFRETTEVATFLIERSKRPVLPNTRKEKARFNL